MTAAIQVNAVEKRFGIALNGCERRSEFVRHVDDEILADALHAIEFGVFVLKLLHGALQLIAGGTNPVYVVSGKGIVNCFDPLLDISAQTGRNLFTYILQGALGLVGQGQPLKAVMQPAQAVVLQPQAHGQHRPPGLQGPAGQARLPAVTPGQTRLLGNASIFL